MNKQFLDNTGLLAGEQNMPKHVAVVMDGNGRWAQQQNMSRTSGHRKGVDSAWSLVKSCLAYDIPNLTLFAFGQENWKRPSQEVRNIFRIFYLALKREISRLHNESVKLRVVGDRSALAPALRDAIEAGENLTQHNTALTLNIAVNYSGRWDIMQAVNQLLTHRLAQGDVDTTPVSESDLERYLSFYGLPEPELFIRTSGVQRMSNFMLWNLAYSEMYFTPTLWPEFDLDVFKKALTFYAGCERRFGLTSEQVALCSNTEF